MVKDFLDNTSRLSSLQNTIIGFGLLSLFVLISFLWNYGDEYNQMMALAKKELVTNFDKNIAVRHWATGHGGIYVPVTEATPPNPYLKNIPEREIYTPSGVELTLMNPAYIIRQVMEHYEELSGIKGRIISLAPLNPNNSPDEWERVALEKFETDQSKIIEIASISDQAYLRMIHPLVVTENCLKCHQQQGYQVGDIRGGINISLPMQEFYDAKNRAVFEIALYHGLIWICGILAISIATTRKNRAMIERQESAEKIEQLNKDLELRVTERTSALENANSKLLVEMKERLQAEKNITKQKDFLDNVLESLTYPFYIIDTNTYKIIKANSAARKLGIRPDYTCHELTHRSSVPCDSTEHICPLAEIKKTGQPVQVEHIHTDANNNPIQMEVHGYPIFDGDGKIKQMIEYSLDITKRKEMEVKLLESEKQLSSILNNSTAVIFLKDLNLRYLFINKRFEELFHVTNEEIIGKSDYDVFPRELADKFSADDEEIIRQNREIEFEEIAPHDDGLHTYLSMKFPIHNHAGEMYAVCGIASDITERKDMEEKLMENQEKLKEAQKIAHLGQWERNTVNNTLHLSDEMYRIFDTDQEKLGGSYEAFLEKIHPEDRDLVNQAYTDSVKNKTPYDIIHRLLLKDGALKHVREIFHTEFNEDGEPIRSLGTVQDVTSQIITEKALRQAKEDADSANQTKSVFLANMSHELRTPLNSIIGFSQILEMQITSDLNEKQKGFFENIKNSGNHLLEMVNDILDLSKIEADKIETDLKPFDFGKMLERSPSIIKVIAYQKKVQIETNIQPDLGWINGDETRLKQVIFNLLSNAVKFTESDKRIGIEATAEGDSFIVTVWDEGIGIPEDYLEKVFDPFEQVKRGKGSKEVGTGLGLAISRRLIELHQGKIGVTSRAGEGSRFTITLPGRFIAEESATERKSIKIKSQTANPAKRASILVTEDNLNNRELIKAALDDYGLEFAESGEEAITMASEKVYDLILMDIQLPEMDGTEAMEQIRKNSDKHIPIIALTAYAMKGDKEKYLESGFDEYISKPINIELLVNKIQDIL